MESFSFDMNGIVWPIKQSSTGKNLPSSCVAIHTLFFLLNIFFHSWSLSPLLKKLCPLEKGADTTRLLLFCSLLYVPTAFSHQHFLHQDPAECRFSGQPPLPLCRTSTMGQDQTTDPILKPYQRRHLAAGNWSNPGSGPQYTEYVLFYCVFALLLPQLPQLSNIE